MAFSKIKADATELDLATQAEIDAKAPIASPTFTGTVAGVTATHVGLGNATNESKATMFTSPVFTTSIKVTGGSAPGSPSAGMMYFDSTTDSLRVYSGTAWGAASAHVEATGGIINTYVDSGVTYRVHTFTSSSILTVGPNALTNVDFLVIAGGGAGGGNYRSGGGGAGGYRCSVIGEQTGGGATNTATSNPGEDRLTLTANTAYPVVVGAGGMGVDNDVGANGSDSSFSTITSTGGGSGGNAYGSSSREDGADGGSGGGAGSEGTTPGDGGAASSPTQGYDGGDGVTDSVGSVGAGGGGAGAEGYDAGTGSTGGDGGVGLSSSIDGSATFRGGGGGGGNYYDSRVMKGGTGGGAPGTVGTTFLSSFFTETHPHYATWITTFGEANTGGGGGGQAYANSPGGYGGSGIVIIRYAI